MDLRDVARFSSGLMSGLNRVSEALKDMFETINHLLRSSKGLPENSIMILESVRELSAVSADSMFQGALGDSQRSFKGFQGIQRRVNRMMVFRSFHCALLKPLINGACGHLS